MNEQMKILEMVEKGQITAAEAMELIESMKAVDEAATEEPVMTAPPAVRRNYKFLRIRVTSDNKSVNVSVNIPIRLLTTLGGIAGKVKNYIPEDARAQMEAKGVDITSIDFGKIIEEVLSGTLDDPNIVDVEAWDDEHDAMIKVKIYVE
jgi:excinuclease UvrABC ATPase subunit